MLVLESSVAAMSTPVRSGLPSLVGQVGTQPFDATLAKLIEEAFRCRQLTVFAFPKTSTPRVVSLIADDRPEAVRNAAGHYTKSYWQVDPSNIFANGELQSGKRYAVLMSQSDVSDVGFRRDCYTLTGISHRLSLLTDYRDEWVKISLHRPEQAGPFTQDNLSELLDHGDLLASLLIKHSEMPSERGKIDADPRHFEEILATYWPQLTKRERSVCSLIAIGMGSEAISLTLGVSINTILTFRRRSYARLGISSQNELLRLLYDRVTH